MTWLGLDAYLYTALRRWSVQMEKYPVATRRSRLRCLPGSGEKEDRGVIRGLHSDCCQEIGEEGGRDHPGIGGFLVWSGLTHLKQTTMAPQETIQTIKEDAQWAREQKK